MDERSAIIGAGILLMWAFLGMIIGVWGAGMEAIVVFMFAGLLPSWYFGKQWAVAGYIVMFLLIYLAKPQYFGG